MDTKILFILLINSYMSSAIGVQIVAVTLAKHNPIENHQDYSLLGLVFSIEQDTHRPLETKHPKLAD